VVLAGCAMPPSNDPEALAAYREANDPLEPMNRYFFDLNNFADEILMKPLAGWYYIALPNFAQDGIRNAVNNVRTPVILANDLFQGKFERAGTTFGRFLVNSTLGLGGLFDIAEKMGLIGAIRRLGYQVREVRFVGRDGLKRAGFDLAVFGRLTHDRFISVRRSDVSATIYRAIEGKVETSVSRAAADPSTGALAGISGPTTAGSGRPLMLTGRWLKP